MQNQTPNISPIANCQSPIANGQCTESTRLPWLDFASGIMILWMIVYHALQQSWCFGLNGYWDVTDLSLLPSSIKAIINSEGKIEPISPCILFPYLHFFMPWFFYKSGQFFTKRSVKDLWNKDWNKLLKTFILWSFIGYLLYIALNILDDSLTLRRATYSVIRGLFLRGYIQYNVPMWFLLTLMGVRFVANLVLPQKIAKYAWLRLMIVVLLGYIVSYLAYKYNHRLLPFWLANGAAGFAFFALGYAFRDYEQRWWLVVPCIVVYIAGCIIGFPMVGMLENAVIAGNYMLWIPVAFCCIVVFNQMCFFLYKWIRVKPIEIVGKCAMPIYVSHVLLIVIIDFIANYFQLAISSNMVLFSILLSYIIFLPLFCVLMNTKWYKMLIK